VNGPNGTGSSRRTRTVGLALLGLAVIAVLIGVVVITTGEEQPSATGTPPVTAPPAPGSASASPSVIPFPAPVTSTPAQTPEVPLPSPPEQTAEAPANGKISSRGEVRVYNNSLIRGLAARAAQDFSAAGWTVIEVGNYARGTIPTTTAYYQEGTDQRAEAKALGDQFKIRVEPRFPGIANVASGLIVIVTNDYVSP